MRYIVIFDEITHLPLRESLLCEYPSSDEDGML